MRIINLSVILSFVVITHLNAQESKVESNVYKWKDMQVSENNPIAKQAILKGSTTGLKLLEVNAISLAIGDKSAQTSISDTCETMVLVKEGLVEIQLPTETKTVGTGSMATILPGDKFSIKNVGKTVATCYWLRFNSRKPANKERGTKAGGSFVIDFDKIEFKPHDKGGIRNYYRDRATAMFGFTEMHVTNLNPHIKSHEPHTHSAAEIVLMISGNTEMQIGSAFYKGSAGDLYFLDSNVSHAISNTGDKPCMYYAIQWE